MSSRVTHSGVDADTIAADTTRSSLHPASSSTHAETAAARTSFGEVSRVSPSACSRLISRSRSVLPVSACAIAGVRMTAVAMASHALRRFTLRHQPASLAYPGLLHRLSATWGRPEPRSTCPRRSIFAASDSGLRTARRLPVDLSIGAQPHSSSSALSCRVRRRYAVNAGATSVTTRTGWHPCVHKAQDAPMAGETPNVSYRFCCLIHVVSQ